MEEFSHQLLDLQGQASTAVDQLRVKARSAEWHAVLALASQEIKSVEL